MVNFATIKAQAEQVQNTTIGNSEVTMETLMNAQVKRPLTVKGFNNFRIDNIVNNLPQALTFEGKLVNDENEELDATIYTVTLRPFGDCVIFKTMLQDIIDQAGNLKNITLETINKLVGSTICIHIGENAKGYAVYHFNEKWLINQYIMEQNASITE